MKDDIEAMRLLQAGRANTLGDFPVLLSDAFFKAHSFRTNSVNTKTFVLMLGQKDPLSFVSGQPVSLAQVLKDYNRSEFHHLYPRAFLSELKIPEEGHGPLVNFCFLSKADNIVLGGVAPSVYRGKMPENVDAILDRAICPASLFDDKYGQFVQDRALLLERFANDLIQ